MYIKFLDREFTASRFPWQKRTSVGLLDGKNKIGDKYGWKPSGGMGRFGGGWEYELGINIGGSTVVLQCLVGSISISKPSRCLGCSSPMLRGQPRGTAPVLGTNSWQYHKECWERHEAAEEAMRKPNFFPALAKIRPLTDDELNEIPF